MSKERGENSLENLIASRMRRRAFLSKLATAGGLAVVYRLSGGGLSLSSMADLPRPEMAFGQGRRQVIYLGWGGSWQKAMTLAYFEPFTRQTKIQVTYATPYEFARVKAMQDVGRVEVDFATVPASDFEIGLRQGYYQKLDFSAIDRSLLDESQIVGGYGIVASAISYVLTYNAEKWPGNNHPSSWADFWDTGRFAGPRTLRDTPEAILEVALLADGVPKDKLYPLDVDRAFKKLDQIKEHVKVWYTEVTQSQQLIQNKEVDLAMMVNGRASDSIINGGAPYRIEWNQQIYLGTDKWVVFKGAPNRDNAMRMVGFGGQGVPQAIFAKALFYGPSNSRAFKYIDERTGLELPTHPRNLAKAVTQNLEWWANNREAVTKRWIAWKVR